MRDDRFEWGDVKARTNLIDHGVSFETAKLVFDDLRSLDEIDTRFDYGEDRFNITGMAEGRLLTVTYTERSGRSASFPPERRHAMSRTTTSAKRSDPAGERSVARRPQQDDERGIDWGGMDWAAFDAMTDEEVITRAMKDPDNLPVTDEDRKCMRPRPRAYIIRRALRMTQEEFAEAFRIPIGTLRDWEQGRTEPDQANRAYLKVIAVAPDLVRRALALRPGETMDGAR